LLVCPDCRGALELEATARVGERIRDGALRCRSCSISFPVHDFVPRFVEAERYVDSFSFEWNRFHDVQIDILNRTRESEETFRWKTGWREEDLAGKLVLDVGAGAGRFADVASRWGAEVVGVDLSFAVDVAYRNVGERPNVHLIQADVFRLPFAPGSFDRAYSIGVLHHTPDTHAAFDAVVPFVASGGELAVFVYAHGHYHYFSDRWRKLTTRLPLRLMYGLAAIAVPLYWIHRVPFFGRACQFLLPTANWPDWRWRWLDTFDWYTPKYQWKHTWPEVWSWFEGQGFERIRLLSADRECDLAQICVRGRKR
jgi:SAM-dependent methyltransferase